jgi:uncharacterized membrane protein
VRCVYHGFDDVLFVRWLCRVKGFDVFLHFVDCVFLKSILVVFFCWRVVWRVRRVGVVPVLRLWLSWCIRP